MKNEVIGILAFLLLPVYLSTASENSTRYQLAKNIPSDKIEILASVPKGLPVKPENIRCHIPACSGFGRRLHPISKRFKDHKGIDYSAPTGTPIYATSHGYVSKVVYNHPGYGNYVTVTSGRYTTLYAHCSKITVKQGDKVTPDSMIAEVGNSGMSTGPHVHYEVHLDGKPVDPEPFVSIRDSEMISQVEI